jgi:hypothetical protein
MRLTEEISHSFFQVLFCLFFAVLLYFFAYRLTIAFALLTHLLRFPCELLAPFAPFPCWLFSPLPALSTNLLIPLRIWPFIGIPPLPRHLFGTLISLLSTLDT